MTGVTRTQLLSVPVALTDGTYVIAPAQPVSLPVGAAFDAYELLLALADSDKLATGKSLDFRVERSDDQGVTWRFAEGVDWVSYGPAGLTITDPDGTAWTNRDPTIGIPSSDADDNALYRAQIKSAGIAAADLVVNGLSRT